MANIKQISLDGTMHTIYDAAALHSSNIAQTTGSSAALVMSQKAVTDALRNISGGGDTTELEARIAALESKLYDAMSITSFSMNPSSFEIGSTVTAVTLNWRTNKTPTTLTLSTGTNTETLSVGTTSKSVTGISATYNNNVTFRLTATDEKGATSSKTATATFLNGVYYGAAAEPTTKTYDSAFILKLTKELRSDKKPSFNDVTAGEGQYIYYCLPVSMGTCTFTLGGFNGGFELASTISFTNASGYKENYYIYKSEYANLGSPSVTVA